MIVCFIFLLGYLFTGDNDHGNKDP